MISIGLTGNIASGKSTVAEQWATAGIPVISADVLAREVVEPGRPGLDAVVGAFGDDVLTADGRLDRGVLRERVFGDDEARARLEAILHPRIRVRRDRWMCARYGEGEPVVVSEIPLLFETGMEDAFDVVVFVDAPADVRLRRIVERRGLSEEVARDMMAAQGDPGEKRARADFVIDNSGSAEALRDAADRVLAQVRTREPASGAPEGWLRLDLHNHTRASFDCLSDPERLLARARERGVDRIGLTDHNELDLALEMHAKYPDRVIPGEEVKTAEGIDVIGLYITEVIPKGTPAVDVVRIVREQGGLVYLPHPYAPGKGGGGTLAERLAPDVDVVEVFNARLHPGRLNEPAEELAARFGRLRGAGSDAHTIGEIAGAWVEVPEHPNTAEGLRDALDRSRVRGTVAPWAVHLASTWAKIRKKLP